MNGTEEQPELTTHASWGSGHPRLLVTSTERRFEYFIPEGGATIGSAQECGLRLPEADPVHAVIRHDPRDEYTLSPQGQGETSANIQKAREEEHRGEEILRTGARFTIGPWSLVYMRDEIADHGRPFGGREGGELSDQRLQDPRPDYPQQSAAAQAAAEHEKNDAGSNIY